jgi:hypothetical protein
MPVPRSPPQLPPTPQVPYLTGACARSQHQLQWSECLQANFVGLTKLNQMKRKAKQGWHQAQ